MAAFQSLCGALAQGFGSAFCKQQLCTPIRVTFQNKQMIRRQNLLVKERIRKSQHSSCKILKDVPWQHHLLARIETIQDHLINQGYRFSNSWVITQCQILTQKVQEQKGVKRRKCYPLHFFSMGYGQSKNVSRAISIWPLLRAMAALQGQEQGEKKSKGEGGKITRNK